MDAKDVFNELGVKVAEVVLLAVRNELQGQGHNMSSSLSKSIEYEIKAEAQKVAIEYSLYDYGMILNYGVKPERIPYTQGSGAKTSKFIEGLKRWVEYRTGKSGKEAQSVAFAIARTMKKEGMPTKGSYKYSKNGRRLNWIGEGIQEATPEVTKLINEVFSEVIESVVTKAFVEVNKKNSKNVKINIK